MKVFVITISDVCDFSHYPHDPIVYEKREDAIARLEEIKEDAKADADDDYEIEEDETHIDIWESGRYAENHYTATIDEIEVL